MHSKKTIPTFCHYLCNSEKKSAIEKLLSAAPDKEARHFQHGLPGNPKIIHVALKSSSMENFKQGVRTWSGLRHQQVGRILL